MSAHPHADLIDGYLAHLRAERRSRRSVETYASVLWRAHDALPYGLPLASTDELTAWLSHPTWSPATQSLYTTAIQTFFRWCVRRGHLDIDPSDDLPRPRLPHRTPRPATTEQVQTILATAPEPIRLWSAVAALAGARAIEISRLHTDDITAQWTRLYGKGSRERLVPTHPRLWQLIDGRGGPVADCDERQLSRACWFAYRRHCGLETSIHRLRAWFATSTLQATGDLAAVQDLLGHANPATTRVYAAPSAEQMTRAVAALPDLTVGSPASRPAV